MLKLYKSYTPSLRHVCLLDKKATFSFSAVKYLSSGSNKHAGRNHHGHITVRHQGSGTKTSVRLISYNRISNNNVPGTILTIESDPHRSSFISLVFFKNGLYSYILTSMNMRCGDSVLHFSSLPELLTHGSSSVIKNMPAGSLLYCIENYPGYGTKLVRSAGCAALLLKKENNYCVLKMPSGRMKSVSIYSNCFYGTVSNKEYKFTNLGKAGRTRWLGIRPTVRGIAMNPVDHPHGGGEGRKSGKVCATSPWGKLTKGQKTSRSLKKNYV